MLLLIESEFVESDDVDRLDFVFKLLDLLLNKIRRDLVIFDCGSDLDLEDSVGDGLLFPLSLPEETVHLNSENLLRECLEVGLLAPWLHLPNDERLGNGCSLLLLGLCFLLLLLNGFGGSSVGLGIITKEVHFVFFGGCSSGSSSSLSSTLALALAFLFATFGLATFLLTLHIGFKVCIVNI